MNDRNNVNYTNNDGAKYRYSAPRENPAPKPEKIKQALTKRAVLWRTNKVLAAVILAAVVLLFSILSIWRADLKKTREVEKYYDDIKPYVIKMASSSKSLASLCEATNPDSALYAEAREIIYDLEENIGTPFWKDRTIANRLYEKSEAMFNQIIYGNNSAQLSTAASDDATEYFNEITSGYHMLGSSAKYTAAANRYNKTISTFPLNILNKKSVPVFENFENAQNDSDSENTSSGFLSSLGLNMTHIIVIGFIVLFVILLSFAQSGAKKK